MASIVSMSLWMPLFDPKVLQFRKVALARLSSQETIRTATNLLAPCCSSRDVFSVRSSHRDLTPLDLFGELVSCCVHLSSCTHKTITGYWVGPDIDDGWGFVEAFVNQIT